MDASVRRVAFKITDGGPYFCDSAKIDNTSDARRRRQGLDEWLVSATFPNGLRHENTSLPQLRFHPQRLSADHLLPHAEHDRYGQRIRTGPWR